MSGGPLPSSAIFNTDINPILLGWTAFSWFGVTAIAYVSADAPTFVFSVNADVTGIVEPGMRAKVTQTTDKFFIVTAVGAFSAGVTPITVYGGTDYTLLNAAITAGSFSTHKKPYGFNASPAKWTESLRDTADRTQASPSSATWYNPGGLTLSVPIGVWRTFLQVNIFGAAAASVNVQGTLSTANNSETDVDFSSYVVGASGSAETNISREKTLTITVKTPYFLNVKTASPGQTSVGYLGSVSPSIVRAICAYL